MEMEFKVTGLDGLINKLNSMGVNCDEIVDEALQETAVKIQKEAKHNIMSKNVFDTGELYRSITVEKIPDGYAIGTNLEHGTYNEFGTGLKGDPSVPHTQRAYWRYQDKQGRWFTSHGMKARPFLRPAFNQHKKYAVTLARNKLSAVLKSKISGG